MRAQFRARRSRWTTTCSQPARQVRLQAWTTDLPKKHRLKPVPLSVRKLFSLWYLDRVVPHLEPHRAATASSPAVSPSYDAVKRSAGVIVLDARAVVRVIGDDRVSFFHGMCTADVKAARPGAVLPALFLTEHAHVIAEAFIWVTPDALLLDIDAEAWTRTRAHLEKLLVADDVEFEDAGLAVIDLEGPTALDVAGATPLEPWMFIENDGISVGRLPRFGGPAVSILVPRNIIESTVKAIFAKNPDARS